MREPVDELWTSRQWIEYFHKNARRLIEIPWHWGVELSDDEKTAIAESVREFQLGESGEGRHFKFRAKHWAEWSGDVDYPEALNLFIAEEQRHARDLGTVLDLVGIPRAQKLAVDTIFRHVRKLAGLELCIAVLVTAEIVAQVYYKGLRDATGSAVIQTLCRQILRDEVQHVRFQCQRLAIIRQTKPRWRNAVATVLHWGLLHGTTLIVWRKHGPAMRRGGIGFAAFSRQLRRQMRIATRLMNPLTYAPRPYVPGLQTTPATDKTCGET